MKLSEIFWKAANEKLWSGRGPNHWTEYSCCATHLASTSLFDEDEALTFMESCGVERLSYGEFDEFTYGPERQGARYLTLMFFALVAEEEGI
jgi:hypothetical protein